MISSRKRMPGLSDFFGRKDGGHQTAVPSWIIGMPRRSVGSSREARMSMSGMRRRSAIWRTIELLPMPGAPQMKAAQGWSRRFSSTVVSREVFMLVVRWLPLRGVGAVLQDMQEAVPYRRHSIGGAETTRPSLSGRSALCMRAAEEEKRPSRMRTRGALSQPNPPGTLASNDMDHPPDA